MRVAPIYRDKHVQPEESFNRWLIAAMFAAGGIVLLMFGAIVLSQLWSHSRRASREPPAGEASAKIVPATSPAQPPTDAASAKTEPASRPPAAVPQSESKEIPAAGVKPELTASRTPERAASANAPATTSPPQPSATFIKLSAGTALPQSLPTGTAMGFSIDYEFLNGQPDAATVYIWVITSAQGRAARQGVNLTRRGTLQAFVLEFQPEDGPFQTCLEDAQGRKLSALAPLR